MTSTENYYRIQVNEEDDLKRINKLYRLEELLGNDERSELRYIIAPVNSITAILYDKQLVEELKEQGYELIQQQRTKMIEES